MLSWTMTKSIQIAVVMLAPVGWFINSNWTPDITIGYIGVPANVLVACTLGAFSSFSFGEKIEPRSRLFTLFPSCVIMGAAITGITNAVLMHFHWALAAGAQAGMGAILSCLARFILPAVIERIGPWLDKIPFLRKRKE